MLSTMVPEYPPSNFGNKVITELKIAYWVAVNDKDVKLESQAIKAAVAIPADKLSAAITIINAPFVGSAVANHMNNKLVAADKTAPSNNTFITPTRNDKKPPIKLPTMVIITPKPLLI